MCRCRTIVLWALLACSGASVACGYALAGRGSYLPAYINVIGVPPFVNRSTVFNLETLLTEKVRSVLDVHLDAGATRT